MQDTTENIRDFAENLWQYFAPKIEQRMSNSVRYYRAQVTANNGDGTLAIQRPYDNEIVVPCIESMKDAEVGSQVTVLVFGGTALKNSIVVADGKVSDLGGGEDEVVIEETTPIEDFKLWIDTSEDYDSGDFVMKSQLLDMIFPIGAIYASLNNTSPASILGGTWERIKDTFLLAAGDTYTAGSTGGEATHTLIENELPVIEGSMQMHGEESGTVVYFTSGHMTSTVINNMYRVANGATGAQSAGAVGFKFGGGGAHNNMPPYLTAFVWQRTA